MVETGKLDAIEEMVGLHLVPPADVEPGKVTSLLMHNGLGTVKATITGKNAHASLPQDGINAVEAGVLAVNAADLLGIDPVITVALQTVGGILGNAFAPGCVIMGLSTTGYTGKDSDILQKIIPVSATLGIAFGLFAFLVLL